MKAFGLGRFSVGSLKFLQFFYNFFMIDVFIFFFVLESIMIVCVFLVISPFNLNYQICGMQLLTSLPYNSIKILQGL